MNASWERELKLRGQDAAANVPRVKIETDRGDIVLELFENHAPNTVANFISLVESGFYDGQIFFRVTPIHTVVGGCPLGNGTGNPGYFIKCECYDRETRNHFPGTITMINNGRDTGGSRFAITKQSIPQFDGKNTAFGRVIEGMETIYKIQVIDTTNILQRDSTVQPTKIVKMSVLNKLDHPYVPEKIEINPPVQDSVGNSNN
jgi:cyclophilin family peptidyl-prolyl cis-trans isomerase